MIELCELYVKAIEAVAAANGLEIALQKAVPTKGDSTIYVGALYLLRKGTTIPDMTVAFTFQTDRVILQTHARNELNTRTRHSRALAYAGGIDGWLGDMNKDLQAGRLAAEKDDGPRIHG
jgi:hypothetical protein